MSLVNISRMSPTAWRSLAMRSMPKPNAKPLQTSGSRPPAASTLGWTMPQPPSSSQSPVGVRMSNSADGSVNGKYDGPQARREVAAEERLRERLDRAGQVGHRDVAIDDEPLDLVEHRHVRGVGRVATEHPPGSDHVDRRRRREHRADLHRRRVRAQHGRSRATIGRDVVDEQRVELAARRVTRTHVQRLEVVPVGLDLGSFGDLEAQPDEHVLETLPRLRHEVGVSAPRLAGVLRQIESLGLDASRQRGAGELGPAGLDRTRRPRPIASLTA